MLNVNLIWVPNQQIALFFLAFCNQNSEFGSFCIYVQDESVIPEMSELAEEMGVKFVNKFFALNNPFENFFMYSWGLLSYQDEIRSSVTYKKLWLFGDGFNNSFYLHSNARKWDIEGRVYFGYELEDESFIANDNPNHKHTIVIGLNEIISVLKVIQKRRGIQNYKEFIGERTFLVLDRYWGADAYRIRDWTAFRKYTEEIMRIPDDALQIVFKEVEPDFIESSNVNRYEVVKLFADSRFMRWSDIVRADLEFPYLTSPEALLLGDRISPKITYAFDGSTSLVAQLVQKEISVIWPDQVDISGIFHETWVENLVKEKAQLYRQIVSNFQVDLDRDSFKAQTTGVNMREFIGRFIAKHYETRRDALTQERDALTQERDALTQERDALTQERDALTQERDALTQERDALTQERDALTQERDALTQERDALTQERDALVASTIWRTTKNIRRLISWLKKYR